MPETIVTSDRWGQLVFYDEWNSLELKWFPSTADSSDEDLKHIMMMFADEAVKRRTGSLIVDATEFGHAFGDDLMKWRNEALIPKYNRAGVTKMAFIASANIPFPTVEDGATPEPDGPANFPTGWFKSREAAYKWLAS